jgi:[ribosomal protein S5]-alanine N-acetyltransferase
VLQGERVALRPYTPEDVDLVETAMRSDDARVWNPLSPPPRHELARRADAGGHLSEGRIDLIVEAEGRAVGEIDARQPRFCLPPGVYELGITLFAPADRGRGYGREAIALLNRRLFEQEGGARVELTTDVDNGAMRAVAERLGFRLEGVLRSFMPTMNGRRDYAMYAMTREDWETWTFPS